MDHLPSMIESLSILSLFLSQEVGTVSCSVWLELRQSLFLTLSTLSLSWRPWMIFLLFPDLMTGPTRQTIHPHLLIVQNLKHYFHIILAGWNLIACKRSWTLGYYKVMWSQWCIDNLLVRTWTTTVHRLVFSSCNLNNTVCQKNVGTFLSNVVEREEHMRRNKKPVSYTSNSKTSYGLLFS